MYMHDVMIVITCHDWQNVNQKSIIIIKISNYNKITYLARAILSCGVMRSISGNSDTKS